MTSLLMISMPVCLALPSKPSYHPRISHMLLELDLPSAFCLLIHSLLWQKPVEGANSLLRSDEAKQPNNQQFSIAPATAPPITAPFGDTPSSASSGTAEGVAVEGPVAVAMTVCTVGLLHDGRQAVVFPRSIMNWDEISGSQM